MKTLQVNYAKQFIDLVLQGLECWKQAGEIAAKAIADDPEFIDTVVSECPDITAETVRRFERIGLGQLHPQLCLSESPGVRRLRKLSYLLQERYATSPVELLVKADGKYDTLQVDVRNLTHDQAAQVFDANGLRSAAAQRAYIENAVLKRTDPPARGNLPYRTVKDDLVIMQPCRISKKDLARILADMA